MKKIFILSVLTVAMAYAGQEAKKETVMPVKNPLEQALEKGSVYNFEKEIKNKPLNKEEKAQYLAKAMAITRKLQDGLAQRISPWDGIRLATGSALSLGSVLALFIGIDQAGEGNSHDDRSWGILFALSSLPVAALGLHQLYWGLTKEERISRLKKAYALEALLRR